MDATFSKLIETNIEQQTFLLLEKLATIVYIYVSQLLLASGDNRVST